MIISLSEDKSALVGIEQGSIDEESASFSLVGDGVYLRDKKKKMRFKVNSAIKEAILNKGYIILCQSNPFDFFKVRMSEYVSK